jgi:acyl carrier protein
MTANTQVAPDVAPDVAVDKEELRSFLAHVLELDVEEITDDTDFARDLDLDSLMALEIVVRLQRQYGVKLVERDLKHITSLPQILELISAKRAAPLATHPA